MTSCLTFLFSSYARAHILWISLQRDRGVQQTEEILAEEYRKIFKNLRNCLDWVFRIMSIYQETRQRLAAKLYYSKKKKLYLFITNTWRLLSVMNLPVCRDNLIMIYRRVRLSVVVWRSINVTVAWWATDPSLLLLFQFLEGQWPKRKRKR